MSSWIGRTALVKKDPDDATGSALEAALFSVSERKISHGMLGPATQIEAMNQCLRSSCSYEKKRATRN